MTPLSSATVAKVGPKCSHGVGCLYIKSLVTWDNQQILRVLFVFCDNVGDKTMKNIKTFPG
jgi:hypothetical protein